VEGVRELKFCMRVEKEGSKIHNSAAVETEAVDTETNPNLTGRMFQFFFSWCVFC